MNEITLKKTAAGSEKNPNNHYPPKKKATKTHTQTEINKNNLDIVKKIWTF